jgi:hypothetical protein
VVAVCAGACVGGIVLGRVPATRWLLGLAGVLAAAWITVAMLVVYLGIWRVRLFGRTTAALVRSVTIGSGSGENKDPDHAIVSIDGHDVDIVLSRPAGVGGRVRVRYDPKDPNHAWQVDWSIGNVLAAVFAEALPLVIIGGFGYAAIGGALALLRAAGVGR